MPRPPHRTDDLNVVYVADTANVAPARAAVVDWLRAWSSDDDLLDEMAIVVSELFANAVDASPRGEHHVLLRICRDVDAVVLEVTNRLDGGRVQPQRWDLDDPLRGGGRGLLIVDSLVDSTEFDERPGETTVRCRKRIGAAG